MNDMKCSERSDSTSRIRKGIKDESDDFDSNSMDKHVEFKECSNKVMDLVLRETQNQGEICNDVKDELPVQEFALKNECTIKDENVISVGKSIKSHGSDNHIKTKSDQCSDVEKENSEENVLENCSESANENSEPVDDDRKPSWNLHMEKLGQTCRLCGEMTVLFSGSKKGVAKREMVKYVRKVWGTDISEEDPDVYPVNVCQYCERKVKRLYFKVSKKKKCDFYRASPAEFYPHSSENCIICSLTLPVPPTPKPPKYAVVVDDAESSVSDASEPRRNPSRNRSRVDLPIAHNTKDDIMTSSSSNLTGRQSNGEVTGLEEHDYVQDDSHSLSIGMKGVRMPYRKQALSHSNEKYVRQDRLKPLITHIEKYCQQQKEDKLEVLFFLLRDALRDAGDKTRMSQVEDIWVKKNIIGLALTEEECLAKRVMLRQTKDQYRKEYNYYKEKLEKPVLKPPFIVDKLEKTYFPECLEYFITEGENGSVLYQHEKSKEPSFFSITGSNVNTESSLSSILGVRWRYFDAVAKTLEEIGHSVEHEIQDLGEDVLIKAVIVDVKEEKKDMTHCSDKPDGSYKGAPGKSITLFFAIQALNYVSGSSGSDSQTTVQRIYGSSSETVSAEKYRPLMKALVSDGASLNNFLVLVEEERSFLANKVLHMNLPGGTPCKFFITFAQNNIECKRDYRNLSGLAYVALHKAAGTMHRYGNLCTELKRQWLQTSPRLVEVGSVAAPRTRCSRCGLQGHNMRRCSIPAHDGGSDISRGRKRKKERSLPDIQHQRQRQQQQQQQQQQQPIAHTSPQQQLNHQHHKLQNLKATRLMQEPTQPEVAVDPQVVTSNCAVAEDQIMWTTYQLPSHHLPHHSQLGQVAQMEPPSGSPLTSHSSNLPSHLVETHSARPPLSTDDSSAAQTYVWTYTLLPSQQTQPSQQHPPSQHPAPQHPQPTQHPQPQHQAPQHPPHTQPQHQVPQHPQPQHQVSQHQAHQETHHQSQQQPQAPTPHNNLPPLMSHW